MYSLREENFYFAALRAYQELRSNYFEEIEAEADAFVKKNNIPANGGVPYFLLANLLEKNFGYSVEHEGLDEFPELQSIRSVFNPHSASVAHPLDSTTALIVQDSDMLSLRV